jgi:hypothetical protein
MNQMTTIANSSRQRLLNNAKIDPIYAAENFLGIKLSWYQKLTLKYLCYFDLRFRNKRLWPVKHRNLKWVLREQEEDVTQRANEIMKGYLEDD